jgi:hypothetical protein
MDNSADLFGLRLRNCSEVVPEIKAIYIAVVEPETDMVWMVNPFTRLGDIGKPRVIICPSEVNKGKRTGFFKVSG